MNVLAKSDPLGIEEGARAARGRAKAGRSPRVRGLLVATKVALLVASTLLIGLFVDKEAREWVNAEARRLGIPLNLDWMDDI